MFCMLANALANSWTGNLYNAIVEYLGFGSVWGICHAAHREVRRLERERNDSRSEYGRYKKLSKADTVQDVIDALKDE